jgi:hypothetical protein
MLAAPEVGKKPWLGVHLCDLDQFVEQVVPANAWKAHPAPQERYVLEPAEPEDWEIGSGHSEAPETFG